MSALALEAAAAEIEVKLPGGGGPGYRGPQDPGGGGRGDGDDHRRRAVLYRLGLALVLISITSLFFAVVMVYYTRSRVPFHWEPVHMPPALWLSTAILLFSSLMIEWARRALDGRQWLVYRRRLLLTSFLGFSFIAAQLIALSELVRQGYHLRGNPHASVFYVFTGLHAAHLIGGMVVLNYLLLRRGRNLMRHQMVSQLVAIYWHFMGLIWVGLFAVLMLI
jgi:cytochrome c oxidase subunit III